jgi:tetratricopeptide (TPR) repeat protein
MSRLRLVVLLLVFGTLAVYLPVSHYGFSLYDDNDYVTENAVVQQGLTWSGIQWAFTTWHAGNWHPVTWISHMVDCQLFNLTPGPPHVVNVIIHALNAALLLFLLLRLTGLFWPSAFAAALFAWHPLHVESVAWISERKDVLSTFFGLLTLLCYARYAGVMRSTVSPEPTTGPTHRALFYWLALFFFALGLMSKPMLITLPFVMMLLDFWPINRFRVQGSGFKVQGNGRVLAEKIPFFALAGASCVITFLAQQHGGAVVSLEKVPLALRLENVPVAYALYLLKLFWPAHLAVFYPFPAAIPDTAAGAAIAVLIFISVIAWFTRKKFPYFLVGWLWFLGALVPVIGLVQVGGAAMADRYAYFSSIGIFFTVALGLREAISKFHLPGQMMATGGILILAACLALTHQQLDFWQNDVSLFSHALAVTPDNDTARLNLGFALEKEGNETEAMHEYRLALLINPDNAQAHNNLANLLDETGQPSEALAEYQAALRLRPDSVDAHDNLGTLLVELGRFDEGEKQYTRAAQLDPTDWHAPFLMGKALLKQGQDTDAVSYLQRACQLAPNNPHVLNFAGAVLASDTNPMVRNGQTALAMASKANDLTGGMEPDVLDTLGMAYAEVGQFTNAQATAQDATNLAATLDLTNKVEEISRRLQLYQNSRPFRQSFTNASQLNSDLPKE